MWTVMVVTMSPVLGHAAYFVEIGKDVAIQHFRAESAVKSLDVGVLSRLTRLDVDQFDAMLLCPLVQRGTDEFGAVVQAKPPGAPRSSTNSSKARITRCDGRLVSISMRKDSRLKSSFTLKVRKRRPDQRASAMKSAD